MATTRRPRTTKAQVAATPRSALISTIGRAPDGKTVTDIPRKERYTIYYEMYRQHPTLRAGVEKIAKVAVANGYRFVPANPDDKLSEPNVDTVRSFFRESNGSQLLRLTYKDLLIYGESFWLIVLRGNGEPFKAIRLHPRYMSEQVTGPFLTGWKYGPIYDQDEAIDYPESEVVQFKFDDPDNDIRGLSLLSSLEISVAGDLFAMKFNEKYFENAAHTGTIFNMKNASAEEVLRNREWIDQNYVGNDNAHRPIILEGDIDVQKSVNTRQEMQFIELRDFSRQEILSVLDIDPTKIGVNQDSNRSTSKEADNTFRQENIAPLQLVVEEELNNHLIRRLFGWEDMLFRQNDSSRRDMLDMMKLYGEGEKLGVFSINQIGAELGLPPIPGGDVHFIQTAAGAIPVEWLDDVAARLIPSISPVGSPTGTPSGVQPTPPDPADNNEADVPPSEGTGGQDQVDG